MLIASPGFTSERLMDTSIPPGAGGRLYDTQVRVVAAHQFHEKGSDRLGHTT